jgi:Ca2+-binding RTX toxin-like protein
MLRIIGTVAALALLLPAAAFAQDDPCAKAKAGEHCGPGNGRKTPGGAGKVSHKGWPAITGVFWYVEDNHGHTFTGGPDNDELLGLHGNDTLNGAGGNDVIWGDQANNNPANQTDVLYGGPGNDFIYPSHGTNRMFGGEGNDRIIAYYGHGTIDCGPGNKDYAQVRENGAYKTKNCELIRHFCAFGSKPNGDCKKPGESAFAALSGQEDQDALLSRLVAW